MAGKIVNLRLARKRSEREAKRDKADENAAKHGLAKPERDRIALEEARAKRDLDGKRRED